MTDRACDLAIAYGIRVEFADLGDWGASELRAEYDPDGPVIRVNVRMFADLTPAQAEDRITLAIAHELYHHREALGEIPVIRDPAAREDAAGAFARSLLGH